MKLTINSGENAGKSLDLEGRLVIGRDSSADLVLDKDDEVSRQHAYVEVKNGEAEVGDLDSRNGTFVNGQRIRKPRPLKDGDKVRIGKTEFDYAGDGDAGRTVLAASEPETKAPPPRKPPTQPPPPAPRGQPSPPRFERSGSSGVREALTRRSRVATAIAVGALVVAVAAVVLAVTGVFSPGGGASTQEIVDSATPSTVLVVSNQGGQRAASGTGWVYDADQGTIVTNSHVVAPGQTFQIGVDGQLRDANLLAVAPCEDLAVLQVSDHTGLTTMPLSSGDDVQQGDTVVALGYPDQAAAQDALVATTGTVSVASTDVGDFNNPTLAPIPEVVQTDAAINPGNSGGPLIGDDKKLVGVNESGAILSSTGSPIQNENFAVSVDRVKAVVPQLADGTSIGYLGLGFDVSTDGGLVIQGAPDSTKSGQQGANGAAGAVIATIDGQPVPTFPDYCKVVRDLQPGDPVTLESTTGGTAGVVVE